MSDDKTMEQMAEELRETKAGKLMWQNAAINLRTQLNAMNGQHPRVIVTEPNRHINGRDEDPRTQPATCPHCGQAMP